METETVLINLYKFKNGVCGISFWVNKRGNYKYCQTVFKKNPHNVCTALLPLTNNSF